MKILLIHNFYTVQGGEDIVFRNELAALKHFLGEQNVFEYTASSNVTPVSILGSIFFSRKHYKAVYQMVRQNGIDIVHVHNFFPVLTASVFIAAKKAGAKVLQTVHNYRWWCIGAEFYRSEYGICNLCIQKTKFLSGIRYKCYQKSLTRSIIAQSAFWFYKRTNALAAVDRFFALTSFQKQKLIELGIPEGKISVKHNFIADIPQAGNQPRHGYVFAGRLESSKGIELLLSVWDQLPPDFSLTIIGTGSLEQTLKQQYQRPNIIFKGKCTQEETFKIAGSALFAIQPSLWYETFGLTIIESMRMGVPVIGFDIGTRPELIRHMETGFITTPGELAETILFSASYNGYASMSENARKSSETFMMQPVMERQLSIYGEMIAN